MNTLTAVDMTALLDQYKVGLRDVTDAELERRAAAVAALPGWFADELRRLVDAERERRQAACPPVPPTPKAARSWVLRVAAGAAVVAGPVAVLAGRGMAGHADAVPLPEQMVYAPAAALALVGAVVAGQRIARWVDDRRHPLAVDVDEADLDPIGKELLARVRAQRLARGEAC